MKYPLPKNDNVFKYQSNQKSIMYNGSSVNKCESTNSAGKVYAIVLNTGLNTNRGNLIQNILFPKPTNFRLFHEIKEILAGMIIIYVIHVSVYIYIGMTFYDDTEVTTVDIFKSLLSDFCALFSPVFLINIVFTTFYFQYKLSQNNISCTSDLRLNAAGKVNKLVLDKTGTLTEEGLDLYGFQTTKINFNETNPSSINDFDQIEKSLELYNEIYVDFWIRLINQTENEEIIKNYKTNYQTNIIYYIECLATCHSIDKIRGEVLGNSIDKSIFDVLQWKQDINEINSESEMVYNIVNNTLNRSFMS